MIRILLRSQNVNFFSKNFKFSINFYKLKLFRSSSILKSIEVFKSDEKWAAGARFMLPNRQTQPHVTLCKFPPFFFAPQHHLYAANERSPRRTSSVMMEKKLCAAAAHCDEPKTSYSTEGSERIPTLYNQFMARAADQQSGMRVHREWEMSDSRKDGRAEMWQTEFSLGKLKSRMKKPERMGLNIEIIRRKGGLGGENVSTVPTNERTKSSERRVGFGINW